MPDFMRALVTGCNLDINTLSAIKPLLGSPPGNCLVLLYEHSFVLISLLTVVLLKHCFGESYVSKCVFLFPVLPLVCAFFLLFSLI